MGLFGNVARARSVAMAATASHATVIEDGSWEEWSTPTKACPSPSKEAAYLKKKVRWWLQDTGSPFDFARGDTLPDYVRTGRKTKIEVETANGLAESDTCAYFQIPAFGENMDPYKMEDCPDVMTVGRRCVDEGYGFIWLPWSEQPFYITPTHNAELKKLIAALSRVSDGGTPGQLHRNCIIPLLSVDYVPYFPDNYNAQNAPSLGTVLTTARKAPPKDKGVSAEAGTPMPEPAQPAEGSAQAGSPKRKRKRGPRKRAVPSRASDVEEDVSREADLRGDGAVPFGEESKGPEGGEADIDGAQVPDVEADHSEDWVWRAEYDVPPPEPVAAKVVKGEPKTESTVATAYLRASVS